MKNQVIVGLGEILWDVFPDGPRFGGAPANFACSAASLIAAKTSSKSIKVEMVSAVGADDFGRRALDELQQREVGTDFVPMLSWPTGRVDVRLDESGHASYTFAENTAWDNVPWSDSLQELALRTSAVCFGTLGQRSPTSQATIRRFVETVPRDSLRILDINLRPPWWTDEVVRQSLPLANVVKLNSDELPELARILNLHGSEESLLTAILAKCSLQLIVLTRGGDGSRLVNRSGEVSDLPGESVEIVDTVGAGDSFTATVAMGLLHGMALPEIHRRAAAVSAYVCSQPGANPSIPPQLQFD
ncbi:MAG: carbohydrate kinase [Planctomycetaceae bacterium]|nr:carbohydrate kinase [Planctomycetaceae bacterium]